MAPGSHGYRTPRQARGDALPQTACWTTAFTNQVSGEPGGALRAPRATLRQRSYTGLSFSADRQANRPGRAGEQLGLWVGATGSPIPLRTRRRRALLSVLRNGRARSRFLRIERLPAGGRHTAPGRGFPLPLQERREAAR